MINSINSYSNYNYTNTFSNNTSNIKSSNTINETSNLVSDKSEAVNKVLGYGVDKDGFFTSDFNEAAGLPKDYKIYAKDIENFINKQQNSDSYSSTYFQVDIAKTMSNAYKVFSQIVPQTSNHSFSQEELANIPYAFVVDNNLNVIKTSSYENFSKNIFGKETSDNWELSFNTLEGVGLKLNPINSNNIFYATQDTAILNKNAYINKDGSIDKGGVLMAFLNTTTPIGFRKTNSLLDGDTKLLGKIMGLDKNINTSELQEFQNFMNTNKTQSAFLSSSNPNEWNPFEERLSMKLFIRRSDNIGNTELSRLAMDLDKEYQEMINSNMSLEEFKTKYLDFKQRHDEFVEKLKEAEKAKGIDYDIYPTGKPIDDTKAIEEAQKNKRKPIQAESKSETYKEDNTRNELLRKLLETKFGKSDELEILFGMKFKGDIGEFNKILSLNSAPKSVDIKA
ncbi:Cj0814 family flagellar-dependent secreted protein [Campylobacter coli]|uniref:Cj0814 family flagellar-dependent secreted protein n=1 Tax=Campylobacter coli TaxID=195 RepID=UPI0016426647|nr:hypothetical protein [Campylobacter coli]